ncbi:MAG TPA: hypothetical protein VJY35_09920 [Candidatus Eisenbacteria bacterium]|nr:hypothetical protein [Candidatus Eisenbacteria bacterium]
MHWRIPMLCLAGLLAGSAALAQDHGHGASTATAGKAPLFDLGTWSHKVTTSSAEAQKYFDQGLVLAYGFNHAQAITAFEQAAKLDPDCAMAYWGMAFAYGPNINWPMDTSAARPAWDALQKARALVAKVTPAERDFIESLARRYDDPAAPTRVARAAMDSAYANAMREVWQRHPDDADAGALFADALMNLNPWNFWSLEGVAAPGTDEIVRTLEAVLQFAPNHPGANHFHIHALEASKEPERAVPSAERLGTLVPDAGHLVHMPGHIWQRVGRYAENEAANVKAARVDSLYVAKYKPQGLYPMMYVPHNVHFIWAAASMEGRSKVALAAARRLVLMVPAAMLREMPPLEFVAPTLTYTLVRFGRWQELLKQPAPPMDLRFSRGMWHYGRGLAYAATGKLARAKVERDSVMAIAKATPADVLVSFNSAAALLRIAGGSLAGEIAARERKVDAAVTHFRAAMAEESKLHYDEPPGWYLPVRQQLGAVLLAADRIPEAEVAYLDDLALNPENGWSLYGLAKCLRARQADALATEVEQRFQKAWARADVKLTASRF